ncbi:MAG: hypothetical protein U1F36_05220 [Planctomycetota bacterium]
MKFAIPVTAALAAMLSSGLGAQDNQPGRPRPRPPVATQPESPSARAPRAEPRKDGEAASGEQTPAPKGETRRGRDGDGEDQKQREEREHMRTFLDEHPKLAADLRARADVDGDGELGPAEKAALVALVRAKLATMKDVGEGRGSDGEHGKAAHTGKDPKPETSDGDADPKPAPRARQPKPEGDGSGTQGGGEHTQPRPARNAPPRGNGGTPPTRR